MKPKSFESFLQQNLSWSDFESLGDQLEISAHLKTKLIQDPTRGTITQLHLLSELLQKKNAAFTPEYLIKNFKFGKNGQFKKRA